MEFLSLGLNKQIGSIPIGFLPSRIPGLKIWPRFNSGITETGTGVSQWDDQSGNGNHLKQTSDASRPSKGADGSILFNGTSDFLIADAFTFAQPEEIFLLLEVITWTSLDRIFSGLADANGILYQTGTTPEIALYAGTVAANNTDLILNTSSVLSAVINGASSSIQINNNTATTGNAGAGNLGGFTLGANGVGTTQHSNIRVKEVIGYGATLSTDQRAQIRTYLARVGGLSI